MNSDISIIDSIISNKIIVSTFVVIVSVVIYKIINFILSKSEDIKGKKIIDSKKGKTYIRLFRSIIRYIFIIITFIMLLKVNGVNVTSLVAGVGIAGVIIGLAIQDWLKDIIRGISIISDGYFSVGDIVKYKDVEGKVIVIGIKSTKIQDLKTGNIKSIANRNIEEIDVVSNLVYLNVPLSYELSLKKSEKIVNSIVEAVKKNDNVHNCSYVGVNGLEDSYINYYIKIECNQLHKLQVRRDALRTVLAEMERYGVAVPYTQIDVHSK